MSAQQSLDDLIVDEEQLNESLLTEIVAPHAGIASESGDFVPTGEFTDLKSDAQTAVVLLHRKAAFELGLADEEGATPSQISQASGINHNTVKTAVRELDEEGIVSNDGGSYTIPTYNYERAAEIIQGP
jgi:DNA-directed RNA polymerase specialized sigma24 family protein